jgi:hypothetical protein
MNTYQDDKEQMAALHEWRERRAAGEDGCSMQLMAVLFWVIVFGAAFVGRWN